MRSFVLLPTNLMDYNLCSEKAKKCEHCSSILMHKKPSVTLLHFHMSEVMINKFTNEFPVLIRDHTLIAQRLANDQNGIKLCGLLQFQDLSMALEVQPQQLVGMFPQEKIEIPPFTQKYLEMITEKWWPHESKSWQ